MHKIKSIANFTEFDILAANLLPVVMGFPKRILENIMKLPLRRSSRILFWDRGERKIKCFFGGRIFFPWSNLTIYNLFYFILQNVFDFDFDLRGGQGG
jgi:hypothetical protein